MSTALEEDLDLSLVEDWDPEYPCEATERHDGATVKASWWSIALCCGRDPITLCSACVEWETRRDRRCGVCLHHDKPDQPNRRYEPIRGKK